MFRAKPAAIWYESFILLGSFPGGLYGKKSACSAGDLDSIPGLGRSSGEGIGYPLQYSFFFLIYLFIGCDESLLICRLSLAVVSKVFSSLWRLLLWWSTGSGAHGLHAASRLSSCGGWAKLCLASGIFPDLVSNQCPLHCKVGS